MLSSTSRQLYGDAAHLLGRHPISRRPSLSLDEVEPDALLADKAYDANALIDTLEQRGITPVIPPKANRTVQRHTDFALYRERNLVERFFGKLKAFRAIATRYDKLASTFLAAIQACRQDSVNLLHAPSALCVRSQVTERHKNPSGQSKGVPSRTGSRTRPAAQ